MIKIEIKSEYWVSQKRKFCDYCKCSIADNKPSVQFHENGKKHKENVRLRLSEMQKKAAKDASETSKIENQMKQMEKAAMKAYMKDIKSNPDFTSQMIKETLESEKESHTSTVDTAQAKPASSSTQPVAKRTKEKKWMEAKTAEDYRYYWHIETGESVWEAPKEGFISIEEQEKTPESAQLEKKPTKRPDKIKQEINVSDLNKQIYGGSKVSEQSAAVATCAIGPTPRQQPYGSWTSVVKQENEQNPDLDLPEINVQPVYVPPLPEEKPKVFKERKAPTQSSSFSSSDIAFKKRKFGGGRNARQRGGDD